jgi:hypothetical protein
MPSIADATGATRPKYTPEANAFVVHRGDQAYLSLDDEAARTALARHSDVHVLTEDEGFAFENDLAFPMPPPTASPGTVGLGDAISRLTGRFRIRECGGCQRRRERLNKIRARRWWAREKV